VGTAHAQDTQHETHGSITTGYRFTDVNGRREKFSELFNLRDGLRLHDLNVYGNAAATNRFFDSYSLTATGIGGEPFAGGQFKLSKDRSYDLRLNFRQTYYNWDRNDAAAHPTGLSGLTSNHNWSTVRKFGSASLAVYASDKLRFNFEFHRTGREGTSLTTRALEYFGAPSFWAGFMRSNPYQIIADLDENAARFAGGISYSFRDWNLFYRAGFQTYEETIAMDNAASGRSINFVEAPPANELLTDASWNEHRRFRSPVSEFSYNGKALSSLRLRGAYTFYRYEGPAAVNASFSGVSRTTSTTVFAPYAVSLAERANVDEFNHIIDQGFSVDLRENVTFHADYRYSRFTIDSLARFESTSSPTTRAQGETEIEWKQGYHNLDLALEFQPRSDLMIRPGIRMMKRDTTLLHDRVADASASRPSKLASPILSVYYSPSSKLSLRGDIQNTTNDGPYTRISPRTDFNTRLVAHYQPIQKVTFENNLKIRNAEYTTTEYENKIRANSTTVRYAPHDRFAVFGTFTYDSFLATARINFIRGTAPLIATWRDQTINRLWQGGFEARPIDRLSVMFTGNYDRTTGAGEISGEPPAFGPLRWPFVTGTVSYEFPNAGRLSLDLQRTYYIEEIMRGDNFSANILGIRWTKDF